MIKYSRLVQYVKKNKTFYPSKSLYDLCFTIDLSKCNTSIEATNDITSLNVDKMTEGILQ